MPKKLTPTKAVDAPEPDPDESESEFMDRCMLDPTMKDVPEDQRRAQCQQAWDDEQEDEQEQQEAPGGRARAYPHILKAVYETPWAILPQRLHTILAILHERNSGYAPALAELETRIAAGQQDHASTPHAGPQTRTTGSVAVLPVLGVLSQRGGMTAASEPLTSTDRLAQQFRQLMA